MNIIGIIPARMGSTRFPGKPMANLLGIPMIGHCYFRSKLSKLLDEVYVATCDAEILDYIKSIGGKAIMTKDGHERASDRTAEALLKIELNTDKKYDIVLMIQGDEPMLTPKMIDQSLQPLIHDSNILVSNLMTELKSVAEHADPNEVKVVIDKDNFALYFSREPIPSRKMGTENPKMLKQVCLISFRRNFLLEYIKMEQTLLEKTESVDMMRVLENGLKVKMIHTSENTYAVDTTTDLKKVEENMANDKLLKEYL